MGSYGNGKLVGTHACYSYTYLQEIWMHISIDQEFLSIGFMLSGARSVTQHFVLFVIS